MSRHTVDPIPKVEWGPGAWQNETDESRWIDQRTGLRCAARRNPAAGAWGGYVEITHPVLCKDVKDIQAMNFFDVHGGAITYSGLLFEGETGWWLGFDCWHYDDLSPHITAVLAKLRPKRRATLDSFVDSLMHVGVFRQTYRTLPYVKAECALLAAQIAAYQEERE